MFDREATVSPALVKTMADSISHRGPDDEGYYGSGAIGLGFRRLSIIDLAKGHQPISNEDGRIWVVFNGEIYNYQALRTELSAKGHVFKTQTDTEVLVHLYEEYGPELLKMLRGMFGFALWDQGSRTLFLARDRVGIKPLYYHLNERFLSFGSEMKAILADPEVPKEIDPAIIDRFLTFYYVPGEETLLRGIRKLAPGTYLLVRDGKTQIRQYWDLSFREERQETGVSGAARELEELLEETVRLHMISDVPVGFLLSGGVDSAAMLSFAVGKTEFPISSYTVGFSTPGYVDERPFAKLASERFGTQHHEISISPTEFKDFLPKYIWHMEEPVCEPPAIALYYVSKLASNFVKVLISGEGGDEAFAGYSNYRNLIWLERLKQGLGPLNGVVGLGLSAVNRITHSRRVAKYAPLFDVPLNRYYLSRTSTPFNFFNSHFRELYSPEFAQHANKELSAAPVYRYSGNGAGHGVLDKMLYVDTKTWLPDDLLLKADKMTMANSVELRVPFLDHKVLELAASLPSNFKVRGWTTKFLAKQALKTRVPKEILTRRKAGFPVPYESWLRKELHGWLRDLLLDRRTLERGYFDQRGIHRIISRDLHSGGFSKEIFSLAVLELWHRVVLESDRALAT